MNDWVPIVALGFSGLSLLVMVLEKTFGGGNALAAKFHALDKQTTAEGTRIERDVTAAINKLRVDLNLRLDEYEDNYRVGLDAIKANITAIQMGLLEFRAKMAEDYVPKGGLDEIKSDMRNGFKSVDDRIEQLQDLIMWSNPDTQPPNRGKRSNG